MLLVKRFLVALCILGLLVLMVFLTRDSVHQALADLTGEEDLQTQLRGLGYLALGAI